MDIYNSYIELAYGYELTDEYEINRITRVIGYLQDNGFTNDEVMYHLIHYGPVINEVLFNGLTQCIPYINNELLIESKAPTWHPEKGATVSDFYREPRCRYTMDDLLIFYYTVFKIPPELRDNKADAGAFRHMLDKYKFKDFSSLDFVLAMIKAAANEDRKVTGPFDIQEYRDNAYNTLYRILEYKRPIIVWRDK